MAILETVLTTEAEKVSKIFVLVLHWLSHTYNIKNENQTSSQYLPINSIWIHNKCTKSRTCSPIFLSDKKRIVFGIREIL